jgi:hypothetical protein
MYNVIWDCRDEQVVKQVLFLGVNFPILVTKKKGKANATTTNTKAPYLLKKSITITTL